MYLERNTVANAFWKVLISEAKTGRHGRHNEESKEAQFIETICDCYLY